MALEQKRKPLSLPCETELRGLVNSGKTDKQIAALKNCTARTVRASRKRFSIAPARPRKRKDVAL